MTYKIIFISGVIDWLSKRIILAAVLKIPSKREIRRSFVSRRSIMGIQVEMRRDSLM